MLPYTFQIHPDGFKDMLLNVMQAHPEIYSKKRSWHSETFWTHAMWDYCENGNLHALKHIKHELGNGINWRNSNGLYDSCFLSKRFSEQQVPIKIFLQTYPEKYLMYNDSTDRLLSVWSKMKVHQMFVGDRYYRMVPNIDVRFPYIGKNIDKVQKDAILMPPKRHVQRHLLDSIEV